MKDSTFDYIISIIIEKLKNSSSIKNPSKYQLLYQIIKKEIESQTFPTDWHLPPTRTLAKALKCSRSTAVKAYEMLLLENLIESKVGSGYKIIYTNSIVTQKHTAFIDESQYPKLSERGISFSQNKQILNRPIDNSIAFQPGLPPIDIFPLNTWKKLIDSYWSYIKASELSYSQASGKILLKKQIANYLKVSRNIHCDPEQIIIVSGSLQSLYLISTILLDKGDQVILEDPTFPNVHSVFKSSLAQLIPLSLDDEGIDLSDIRKKDLSKLKLIHVTPNNHYPLGVAMSNNRKKELIQLSVDKNAYIIENDYEHEIVDSKLKNHTIFDLDKSNRTIYLGTFNRLLFPSIRLGYMVLPKHLVNTVESLQEHSHRFVAPITQMAMSQFIEKNLLYSHLKKLKSVIKERSIIFDTWFDRHNFDVKLISTKEKSLHKVLIFDDDFSIEQEMMLYNQLLKSNVSVYRLSKCYVQQKPKTGLILGYATVPPSVMKQKLTALQNALKQILKNEGK